MIAMYEKTIHVPEVLNSIRASIKQENELISSIKETSAYVYGKEVIINNNSEVHKTPLNTIKVILKLDANFMNNYFKQSIKEASNALLTELVQELKIEAELDNNLTQLVYEWLELYPFKEDDIIMHSLCDWVWDEKDNRAVFERNGEYFVCLVKYLAYTFNSEVIKNLKNYCFRVIANEEQTKSKRRAN